MTSGRLDPDRRATALEERVLSRYPVFRQRPADAWLPWQLPWWEDDPDFDLARHLHVGDLAAPGDDLVCRSTSPASSRGRCAATARSGRSTFSTGTATGSAVYSRLHHSLADCIALTKVLLSLTDASPEGTLVADDWLAPHHQGWLDLGGSLVGHLATLRSGARDRASDARAEHPHHRSGGQAAPRQQPGLSDLRAARAAQASGVGRPGAADRDQEDRTAHRHDGERRGGRGLGRRPGHLSGRARQPAGRCPDHGPDQPAPRRPAAAGARSAIGPRWSCCRCRRGCGRRSSGLPRPAAG